MMVIDAVLRGSQITPQSNTASKPRTVRALRYVCLAALFALGACSSEKPLAPPATSASPATAPPTQRVVGPLSDADAKALAGMVDRVKDYVELHKKLEASLPKLPKDATPQQIDQNQRALGKLVQ